MSTGATGPELDRSLTTDERADSIRRLLTYDAQLEAILLAVDISPDEWPAEVRAAFRGTGLPGDTAAAQLRRWASLFNEEAALVHEVRNRIVHQVRVSDAELLKAKWLAEELLRIAVSPAAQA